MMQVIPKWKIVAHLPSGKVFTFWMSDPFLSNVLQCVAAMQFTENGLGRPREVIVSEALPVASSTNTASSLPSAREPG